MIANSECKAASSHYYNKDQPRTPYSQPRDIFLVFSIFCIFVIEKSHNPYSCIRILVFFQ